MQCFEHQWQQLRDYHASNGIICPKHFARAAQSLIDRINNDAVAHDDINLRLVLNFND